MLFELRVGACVIGSVACVEELGQLEQLRQLLSKDRVINGYFSLTSLFADSFCLESFGAMRSDRCIRYVSSQCLCKKLRHAKSDH